MICYYFPEYYILLYDIPNLDIIFVEFDEQVAMHVYVSINCTNVLDSRSVTLIECDGFAMSFKSNLLMLSGQSCMIIQ